MATTVNETSYHAQVERDESGAWVAVVPDLHVVTDARNLTQLRTMLQDAIALSLELVEIEAGRAGQEIEIPRDTIAVDLDVRLPGGSRRIVDAARRRRERARVAEAEAAAATRDAARSLTDQGYSRRDVAELLGLSHQRIDQLLRTA
jgi:predicted RNase H-like HicB family nuclease